MKLKPGKDELKITRMGEPQISNVNLIVPEVESTVTTYTTSLSLDREGLMWN